MFRIISPNDCKYLYHNVKPQLSKMANFHTTFPLWTHTNAVINYVDLPSIPYRPTAP